MPGEQYCVLRDNVDMCQELDEQVYGSNVIKKFNDNEYVDARIYYVFPKFTSLS